MPSFDKNKMTEFEYSIKQEQPNFVLASKQHNIRCEFANHRLKSAQNLCERERFGEPSLLLQQLLIEDSTDSRISLQLALSLQLAGRRDESESYFLSTLDLAPGAIIAVVGLSQVWRENGKTKNAITLLKSYLVQLPNNSLLISEYANICHAAGYYTSAVTFNYLLRVLDPLNGNAFANIAESLSELQRHDFER